MSDLGAIGLIENTANALTRQGVALTAISQAYRRCPITRYTQLPQNTVVVPGFVNFLLRPSQGPIDLNSIVLVQPVSVDRGATDTAAVNSDSAFRQNHDANRVKAPRLRFRQSNLFPITYTTNLGGGTATTTSTIDETQANVHILAEPWRFYSSFEYTINQVTNDPNRGNVYRSLHFEKQLDKMLNNVDNGIEPPLWKPYHYDHMTP